MPRMKILVNGCYGGFSISDEARDEYKRRTGDSPTYDHDTNRYDPVLIQIYEEFGSERFSGFLADICVKTIDEIYKDYHTIDEYDGIESINIDYAGYEKNTLIYRIKMILLSATLSNEQKILQISNLVN